uniref:Uncharacterized protein n=1 Tax=Catagonus wagneri TaxID=51154 RepID=A0A8C3WI60_9CETA
MGSEKKLMETEQHWIFSASERYVMDSNIERDGIDSVSASGVHLMGEDKHQEKTRTETYMTDSDSEPCRMDSDSKRHGLASASMKCLMETETFQLSTGTKRHWMDSWSERRSMDLDSESLCMASDSVKYMMKAENCQRDSDLERFRMGLRSESERCCTDSEMQQLDSDRYFESSRRHQHRSSRFQGSSRRCHDDLQKHWDKFEKHHIDTNFEKHQNEFESERYNMEMEREQCLIEPENERLQMEEKRGKHLINSDSEKEHKIISDKERHHLDSEIEAQRLGARRKDNRPQGFWRPIFLSPPYGQGKETEEQHFVQQVDNRVISRIQLVRYHSDDKIVRFKELAPTLRDKQDSWKKLKEKHSHNLFLDPNTFMDNKHHKNANHKISVCKSCHTDYRYQQRFQSSKSQVNLFHLISAKYCTSEVSTHVYHPTSMSPWSAVHPKTHRNSTYNLDAGAQVCSKYFVGISNSSFHKCLVNSDDDSDPDCTLHLQISLDSKYSLRPKSIRHHKTSWNSPLSRSLDPKHPVGIRCPLHRKDSKYSLGSTSYLHCESCSALQNLMGSTVTRTFPMNPQNNTDHRSTPGPVINTSSTSGLERKGKFNLTTKFENYANLDDKTKLVSTGNLKDKANVKDKLLVKDDTDHEDETDSEDEEDHQDETDPEGENNAKDKKDPKDRSDPDDTDPKDSNAENDSDTNNGSDASGDADPASGADSNRDGDSSNGTDSNSEPDSNNNNVTNNDANSKYSTDSEEDKHTNISDIVSGLDNSINRDCTADSNNGTNPNYTSGLQNGTGLNYTSGSSNGSPGSNNNGSSPNINGLDLNNSPVPNNSSPGGNNSPDLTKESYSNSRPSNATSHNAAISPNKDSDSVHETKPISAAGHNYTAIPNCDSNLDYVPEFTHAVGSNFVVGLNYIARNSCAASISSTATTVNVIDTTNTTNCIDPNSPTYTAGTSCASDTNHDPRFTHVIGSNFVINPNYDAINIHNVHNSTSTRNINNLPEPELEINSNSSVLNIFYGNAPVFVTGTNYISTPEKLTTHKFFNPSKLVRYYAVFDNHKFGACLKDYADSMDLSSFKDAAESKDVLDAKESSFLKDFSEVQNPIGIKDPASLNFHSNSNIPLPSFDIIVEAEPPDVMKFAIPSGAVNEFFKQGERQDVQYYFSFDPVASNIVSHLKDP